jgi:hypothetical protein
MTEVLIHVKIYKNLENVTLSKRSQRERPHNILFHLYKKSRTRNFIEIENRLVTRQHDFCVFTLSPYPGYYD